METKTLTKAAPAGSRLAYIDNIRWTVIAMVVLMHTCVTYSSMGSWFYVEKTAQDIASTLVFGIYQSFAQAFFMGLLFFIAGTLIPAAYDRKGFLRFMADRAVRLGVPSLVFMLLLDPLTTIIRKIGTGEGVEWAGFTMGYRDFVLSGRFLGSSGPLWFAVALLVFSVVYAAMRLVADLLRGAASRKPAVTPRTFTARAINIGVACVIALIALIAFLVRLVQPLGTSVMNMQLGYFSSYVVLFVAGLWAGRNALLAAIPTKVGRTWLWVSIGVGLPVWMILQGLGGALEGKQDLFSGGWHWQALAYAMWESFMCLSMCIGLIYAFRRYLSRRGKVAGFLVPNAYTAYIIHAPVITALAFAVQDVMLHPLLKWAGVALVAVPLCFALSSLIRKLPYTDRVL